MVRAAFIARNQDHLTTSELKILFHGAVGWESRKGLEILTSEAIPQEYGNYRHLQRMLKTDIFSQGTKRGPMAEGYVSIDMKELSK